MSVKLTMKPLKGESFTVEIDSEATVAVLKAKVAEMKSDFPAGAQKLIYSGKILADDSVIKALDIKPDGFVVVMVAKPAAAPAPAPAADAPMPAATPTPAAAPAAATGGAGAPEGVAALGTAPNLPQVILDMKNSPRFKELTMVVVQNPQVLERMLPALGAKWPQLLSAIEGNVEGFVRWLAQEAMLTQLASSPNVPPELQQAIQQNPAAALAMLQRAGAGGFGGLSGGDGEGGAPGGGGGVPVEMNPEEQAAVARLVDMGFDRTMAAQAYFACNKNEELAANFLLSGGDDDDMGADDMQA